MKRIILIKILFILSLGISAQVNKIEKPKNDNNDIHYNNDYSVT